MNDCPFCNLSEKEVVIFDDNYFVALFDPFPVSPGHTTIVPKRHVVNISDLNKNEWNDLWDVIGKCILFIEKTNLKAIYKNMLKSSFCDISSWFLEKAIKHPRINKKPDAYNYGVNDGRAARRTIDHFHWHIIPRYEGDVIDPRGGVRYVIPDMGNYKKPRK